MRKLRAPTEDRSERQRKNITLKWTIIIIIWNRIESRREAYCWAWNKGTTTTTMATTTFRQMCWQVVSLLSRPVFPVSRFFSIQTRVYFSTRSNKKFNSLPSSVISIAVCRPTESEFVRNLHSQEPKRIFTNGIYRISGRIVCDDMPNGKDTHTSQWKCCNWNRDWTYAARILPNVFHLLKTMT